MLASFYTLRFIHKTVVHNYENGLIRRYLPKGTDFNLINKKKLNIQEKLNNRPRKIIGFKTPKEIIDSELKFVS